LKNLDLSNDLLFQNELDLVGDPPFLEISKHDSLNKYILRIKLGDNSFKKNAISHKDLKAFLIKAKKEPSSTNISKKNENQEFNDLIKNWTETSQKLLLLMNNNDKVFTKNRSSKSLMALGAMGAHISMALQALKATESDH
tara:strand:- start:445 stop:867 length:423 start_codon:yes stop_codon:yes gene_type:complete